VLGVLSVLACPSCPPALEARTLVFSEAFWVNASYALLPFVVVGVVVHRFVRRIDRGVRGNEERDS
jgi:hypothetical protein